MKKITDRLVTPRLEEHRYFKETQTNASAENIAKYIFEELEPMIKGEAKLVAVEVQASPGCWAKYAM